MGGGGRSPSPRDGGGAQRSRDQRECARQQDVPRGRAVATGARGSADVTHARVAVGRGEDAGVDVDLRVGVRRGCRREREGRRGRDGVDGVLVEEDESKAGRWHWDRTRVGRLVTVDGRHV